MCYNVKFGSFALKGVGVNRGEPQKWERWGYASLQWGHGCPMEIRPSPHAEFGRSRSNGASVMKEIPLKEFDRMYSHRTKKPYPNPPTIASHSYCSFTIATVLTIATGKHCRGNTKVKFE